ncbi:efflux RND transporter periplasmic adaptor subunit [Aurantivibrio plasticivorans]
MRFLAMTVAVICLGSQLAMLGGCSGEEAAVIEVGSKPVKTLVVSGESGEAIRQFPARVEANQTANLSFRISGTLQELNVREGENVLTGAVLARLDPTDFEIAVREQEASYQTALANFERAKSLMPDGYISRSDYDRLQGQFESARASLEKARQNLAYTELLAPFDGVVARRWVDNFEEITAKTTVISLNNPDLLELVIQIPESLIQQIDRREPGHGADDIAVTAAFENYANKAIPLSFKEISTTADSATQTFSAVYIMPALSDITLLPGMSATVTVDLTKRLKRAANTNPWIPSAAVFGANDGAAQVFIVDEENMNLIAREVTLGSVGNSRIEVVSGVEPGERIVVAGVSFLQPGQQVTIMPDVEQATEL